MNKNMKLIRQHLESLGFKFFDDLSYWDWGGQQFEDNQVSQKALNRLYKLQEKMSENPSYSNKIKFYEYIAADDIFLKVIHSMKLNAIAESCNQVINEIKEKGNVLDLGCNTGYLTSFYSDFYQRSQIYGFDVCKKSIFKAKQLKTTLNNLKFINNLNEINGLDFSLIIDTQCLSEINDEKILDSLIKKVQNILSKNGSLISISALTNEEVANSFIRKIIDTDLFLYKMEPVIFKGIEGFEAFTKLIFKKKNNNFQLDIFDYFKKIRIILNEKNTN